MRSAPHACKASTLLTEASPQLLPLQSPLIRAAADVCWRGGAERPHLVLWILTAVLCACSPNTWFYKETEAQVAPFSRTGLQALGPHVFPLCEQVPTHLCFLPRSSRGHLQFLVVSVKKVLGHLTALLAMKEVPALRLRKMAKLLLCPD